jgi:F-type H+-transporting ATPase subunit b
MGVFLLASEDAAGHGAAQTDVLAFSWLPAITTLLVFLVAFGFLYLRVWPRIVRALDERQAKIRAEIESAEETRRRADEALAEYQRSLAEARAEAARLIAQARADAQAVAAELRARNEVELTELRQRAAREIEHARTAAVAELHTHAVTLAADIAAKILRREITPHDQQRLLDDSLRELAGRAR